MPDRLCANPPHKGLVLMRIVLIAVLVLAACLTAWAQDSEPNPTDWQVIALEYPRQIFVKTQFDLEFYIVPAPSCKLVVVTLRIVPPPPPAMFVELALVRCCTNGAYWDTIAYAGGDYHYLIELGGTAPDPNTIWLGRPSLRWEYEALLKVVYIIPKHENISDIIYGLGESLTISWACPRPISYTPVAPKPPEKLAA